MLVRIFARSCLLALTALCSNPRVHAAPPDGRAIFRQHCAKCHGKNGEGVKGKYDDALHGDWAVEKLTRVIEKTMPEDDPDKINGPQVEAVARYIYDAFYSREARARNHPARVELARLTNRQYVHTVADLLGRFAEKDGGSATGERGLRATYFGNRNFNREITQRVDRVVDLNYGTNSPFPEKTGTNGFSMQWRGSIIADETGDHEFALQTPNGVRLWINDDDTPLIDGSVSSGEFSEHKAVRRLIGGRAYPLRLEFFKERRDKKAAITLLWKPPHGAQEPIPARNLSTARATPTFVLTTPFPPDDSSVGYERGVAVSKGWDDATTQAAIEVANHVVQRVDRFARTRAKDTNRVAKAQAFCEEFVTAAFRRPLSAEQKRLHVSNVFKSAPTPEDAVKRVVLLALKSPRFLYLGLDGAQPDDFEVAARLSFGLWDSLPDAELTRLAAQGALRTEEQVRAQARRLLGDARARAKVRAFLHHWLQMNHVEDFAKDAALYPGFTPEIVSDLRASLDLFLDDVVWSESSDYRRLLLEDDLFINNRLAKFYGVDTNVTDDFLKVSLDPRQRSGVITHPYLLAAFSYPKASSPIHRGVFLTRNIVGRALKPPPMAVSFNEADFAPNLTMREKVAELTRPQACQGCHSVINPLGFSLEHYDAVGRFRTRDGGKPIDAASDYLTDGGETVRLKGARDVAEFAVGSEHAHRAFIEQLFHQVVKQPARAYGPDTLERLRGAFVNSGFNIQKLLVDIATLAAWHGVEKPGGKKS